MKNGGLATVFEYLLDGGIPMKSKDQKYQEAIQRVEYGMNRHLKSKMLNRISRCKDWKDAVDSLRSAIGIRKNESTPGFIVDFVIANWSKEISNG